MKFTAFALNLEEEEVGAVLLGESFELKEGDTVKRTKHHYVGARRRSADRPRGKPARRTARWQRPDSIQAAQPAGKNRPRRSRSPTGPRTGATGIKAIDAMIPIGRGQRELIIGDRQTGKNRRNSRHHHQPKGWRPDLHLLCNRSEALHDRNKS